MSEKLLHKPPLRLKLIESQKAPLFGKGLLLFSSKEFIELNKNRQVVNYSAQLSEDEPICNIGFDIEDNKAISLLYCPYAGLSIPCKIDNKILKTFIESITKKLGSQGIKDIIIKQPPLFAEKNQKNGLDKILKNCGFKVLSNEINHHIDLSKNNYLNSVHQMQQRKIKKCIQSGFVIKQELINSLSEIHKFIDNCRSQVGIRINISPENLFTAFQNLPHYYKLFTVRNPDNQIMAATVVVIVNDRVVYNYLPAFDRTFKIYSPLTFLTHHLVDLYKKEGYQYLDLGISSADGTPQKSLITFKERMGGIESNRLVYHIEM
ncbi:GNAT family N-acetyltransferase [Reichenbachiella sp. MALMAid0571]|uniref:GNAT family N-acetyltransferase n=1 Tax=Reichenbachiella sp. MALMAid0571 TaxID=3143939 RepID=UPI0032DF84FA